MLINLTRPFRYFATLSFAVFALPANANCSFNYTTASDEVFKIIKENNGFKLKNYDEFCKKLHNANAKIVVNGSSGVLASTSYGWANISVADNKFDNLIVTDFSSNNTVMHSYASNDHARKMLWEAINNALNSWNEDLDKALAKLDQARKAMCKKTANK